MDETPPFRFAVVWSRLSVVAAASHLFSPWYHHSCMMLIQVEYIPRPDCSLECDFSTQISEAPNAADWSTLCGCPFLFWGLVSDRWLQVVDKQHGNSLKFVCLWWFWVWMKIVFPIWDSTVCLLMISRGWNEEISIMFHVQDQLFQTCCLAVLVWIAISVPVIVPKKSATGASVNVGTLRGGKDW
jgi:hypothetical protein